MAQPYSSFQKSGSEYGGVPHTPSGVQPKPPEALSNSERLHLGYATGEEDKWYSIEDHRQMLGLRPASGRRPLWLTHVSPTNDPRLDSVAELQVEVQEDIDLDSIT